MGKLTGGLLGGGGGNAPAPQKLAAPDFGNYWKQYTGWMSNINKRTEGQLADVRARLSAAGASPDLLMQQTEHLESQRKSEIAQLTGGPTYGFLKEGFEIATGKKANPYAGMLPGMATQEGAWEVPVGADPAGNPYGASQGPATTKFAEAPDMESYYSKFFGEGAGATPKTPAEEATIRAKKASAGIIPGAGKEGGGSAGSSSGSATSPALGGDNDSFWG